MNIETRLREIGDRLEEVFAADLQGEARVAYRGAGDVHGASWLATRRGRWLAAVATAAIAVPGVAYAAGAFTSPQTVASSLPAGARIFGTDPSCVVVRANVEYHCTLPRPPLPDPVKGLTSRQWTRLMTAPRNLGPVKIVNGVGYLTRRQERMLQAHAYHVLRSFGFTPTQIQEHENAIATGTAGIPAGGFRGTVEPTVDATRHIDGGCRATSADGSQWECYLGQAAVEQKVVSPPSNKPHSAGLGGYVPSPGIG